LKIEQRSIGPIEAQRILDELNRDNRKMKPGSITRYTRDMENGSWIDYASMIVLGVDENGDEKLVDGQNRLQSIVNSGTEQKFVVITGASVDIQTVIDTGVARSFGDTLQMRGYHHGKRISAVARLVWAIDSANPENLTRITTSNREIEEVLEMNPDLVEATAHVFSIYRRVKVQPAVAGTVFHYGLVREPDLTRDFFTRLDSGVGLEEGDPALALRNRLGGPGKGLNRLQQLWLVTRALNYDRNKQTVEKLQLPRGSTIGGVEVIREIGHLTRKREG
jgi:hypothetical protein